MSPATDPSEREVRHKNSRFRNIELPVWRWRLKSDLYGSSRHGVV